MKAIISILVLAFGLPAMAAKNLDKKACAEFARGAAESRYSADVGAIQGHEFESGVVAYTEYKDAKNAVVLVEIDGANEDQETWTVKYEVEVSLPYCKLESIGEVK